MSIHPNGTAEQIVLDLSAQRLDQLLRSSKLERDHVDDNVCVKASDPRAEFALGFFGLAVHSDLFDSFPGRMLFIGRCRATADIYNRVSALDKLGHEVGSHMSISSNDDDPSHGFLLRLSTFHSTDPTDLHAASFRTKQRGDPSIGGLAALLYGRRSTPAFATATQP